jgi:hypothetical protein
LTLSLPSPPFPKLAPLALSLITVMASDDLDNPSSSPGTSPAIPSPSLDSSRFPASSHTDNRGYISPTLLELPRNPHQVTAKLDPLGSPTHSSDTSPLPSPPFPTPTAHPTGSILWANSTHDNDPEEHDGSCSLYSYLPSHHRRRRKGGIGTVSSTSNGSSSNECDAKDNSSPLHSAHSDVTNTLPLPTLTHLHTMSDAGSRPSPVASFIKRVMHRLRRPPPSPSRETDTGLDTTRNDGQKGDNADVKCKGAELARPAENESPTSVLPLPSEFTDSSRLSRPSPPSFILESPPFLSTPTDPILVPAEPQGPGPQSKVLVGSKRFSTHPGSQT